ncbi:MAG: phospholipase, partial [Chloroflexi bacterium]|nr:phospholipase [Chloroflexota bacterium]
MHSRRKQALVASTSALAGLALVGGAALADQPSDRFDQHVPIHHLVVIFQENVSFDHYFGTYPNA